jgi:hypothetical protein
MQGVKMKSFALSEKNKTLYRFMKIRGITILTLSLAAFRMHSNTELTKILFPF